MAKKSASAKSARTAASSARTTASRSKGQTATARRTVAKRTAARTTPSETQTTPTVIEISESERLARRIAELALTKKAYDITLLDVRTLSDAMDFFVICSADSDRQVKAIADAIYEGLLEEGEKPKHLELRELTWVVMDYITVIVHIFLKERRAFYALEKLWGDARFIHIKEEADLQPRPEKSGK